MNTDATIPSLEALAFIDSLPLTMWEQRLGKHDATAARQASRLTPPSDIEWSTDRHVSARVTTGGIRIRVTISTNPVNGLIEAQCGCAHRYDCEHALALGLYLHAYAERLMQSPSWKEEIEPYLTVAHSVARGEAMAVRMDYSHIDNEIWVSPLRPGNQRRWISKRASWSELNSPWGSVTDGLNTQHVDILRELYDTATDTYGMYRGGDIPLSILSDRAYQWLCDLQRVGVSLVGDMHSFAEVSLIQNISNYKIAEHATDSGLLLQPVSSERLPQCDARTNTERQPETTVGNVAVYDNGMTLGALPDSHQASGEHSSTAQKSDTGREAIHIPWSEAAEYYACYAPFITPDTPSSETKPDQQSLNDAEARAVAHLDSERTQPSAPRGQLVAHLSVDTDKRMLFLNWQARYSVSDRQLTYPLTSMKTATAVGDRVALSEVDPQIAHTYRQLARHLGRTSNASRLWKTTAHDEYFSSWAFPSYQLHDFIDTIVEKSSGHNVCWDLDNVENHPQSYIASVDTDVQISASLHPAKRTDWFDIDITLTLNGTDIPLNRILQALSHGQTHIFEAGAWISLDSPRIHDLKDALEAAASLTLNDTHPQISTWQTHLWHSIESLAHTTHTPPLWERKVRSLPRSGTLPPLALVESRAAHLRSYQYEGHHWLTSLMQAELGGILADDMGLGKTLQTLAAIASYTNARARSGHTTAPILIICPRSVVSTWVNEAQQWYPHMKMRAITETSKKRKNTLAEAIERADCIVTTYAIARLNAEEFAQITWGGCVIDEAHTVKNPRTAAFRAIHHLDRPWTISLTGTPIENSVTDLWALLRLTCPGLLPGWDRFVQRFVTPIDKLGDEGALNTLKTAIGPFLLRRTKEAVASDLPEKTVSVVSIPLAKEAQRFYSTLLTRERASILGLLDAPGQRRVDILASLMRLRQAALDPALVHPDFVSEESAKTRALIDVVEQIVPAGHQALVFSQFTSYLERIAKALDCAGISYVVLDGATRHRDDVIATFKTGQARVFLISLKAGGTGLTLTEADYVFIMDPWWNPAAEEQAIDRAHRIGQNKPVTVYRLVSQGTVEEKVLELQERKRHIASSVIGTHHAHNGWLDSDDIRALLA